MLALIAAHSNENSFFFVGERGELFRLGPEIGLEFRRRKRGGEAESSSPPRPQTLSTSSSSFECVRPRVAIELDPYAGSSKMANDLHWLHVRSFTALQPDIASFSSFSLRPQRSTALSSSNGLIRKSSVADTSFRTSTTRWRSVLADTATVDSSSRDENMGDNVPVLSFSEVTERMQRLSDTTQPKSLFRAMYSSVIGGITTDPAAMVIPMDDHMVHRGHGVFDTAIIHNGFLYELDAHLDRLLGSAAKSKVQSPFDRATLRHILLQTVAASGCRMGSLRYWLSAGLGGFGLSSNECYQSTFYAMVVDVTYKGPEGVKVITSTVPIKPPFFATVKTVNYLPNVLAQLEAEEQGAFTAVWLDNEGYIAEGPSMNVAVLTTDGVLLFPPFDNALAGCTARRVLKLVPTLVEKNLVKGLVGVKVQNVSVQEARSASEMMLIGSGVLVKPIVEWDGIPVGTGNAGPVTSALREAMQRDMEDLTDDSQVVPVPYPDGV